MAVIWRSDKKKLERIKREGKKERKKHKKEITTLQKQKAPTIRNVLTDITHEELMKSARKLPAAYFPTAAVGGEGRMSVFQNMDLAKQKLALSAMEVAEGERTKDRGSGRGKGTKKAAERVVELANSAVHEVNKKLLLALTKQPHYSASCRS